MLITFCLLMMPPNSPFLHSLSTYEIQGLSEGFYEEEEEEEEEEEKEEEEEAHLNISNVLTMVGVDYESRLDNISPKGIYEVDELDHNISNYWTQFNFKVDHNNLQDPSLQSIHDIIQQEEQPEFAIPDLHESVKQNQNGLNLLSTTSQEILGNYQSGANKLVEGNLRNCVKEEIKSLSTEELMRLAAEKYIRFSSNKVNGYTMFVHPYGSSAFSSLSLDETREVELAYQLLTAAERAGCKQYYLANTILTRCECLVSNEGTPVERLVFYFTQALRKKIQRETGIIMSKREDEEVQSTEALHELVYTATFMACHQDIPVFQVLQFAGIQTIIDHVAPANKIHIIDLDIKSGVQWTVLMQALVEQKSPIQQLKITVIGTRERDMIEKTGMRLQRLAETLNLPFSFKVIFLLDMKELKEEDLGIEADEVVTFYLHLVLRTMISRPDQLEHLMGVMERIKPSIVVVAEVEANHNSTSFVNRFTEALFFYSAVFDCLENCMVRHHEERMTVEGFRFAEEIQNIVSTEGEKRTTRSVRIKVWRSFFARFGMVEVDLSDSSLYQANLVSKQFTCGSSCTLEYNGKCLLVGWKGTPLNSLSAWKFT